MAENEPITGRTIDELRAAMAAPPDDEYLGIPHRELGFYRKYYAELKGALIVDAGVNSEGFPFFVIQKGPNKYTCEVSQDPEGNGAGFLFGLPNP